MSQAAIDSLAVPSTSSAFAPAPAPKVRIEWVDYAKGICIFFVVMMHVNDVVQERAGTSGWLEDVVTFARPFRMPDFFLIAGLFLSSAMRRPWRSYLDSKVVHFMYFYVLWMTLQFVVFTLQFEIRHHTSPPEIVLLYFKRWIDPVGPLWFIHMLPVFFLVTRLLRWVPAPLIWLGAAALHSLHPSTGWKVPDEFSTRYVYFFSGYILAPYVFQIASWAHARIWAALGYLACWGVGNALVVMAGWSTLPFVSLGLGYAGALAVITAAVMFSKISWTTPLRYLGQNSIVVYLGDFWVAFVMVRVLEKAIPDIGARGLISTVLTVIGTIVLWRVTLRTPARFLYERPRWLRLRSDAAPSARERAAPVLAASVIPD